jgi:hypothetical protein
MLAEQLLAEALERTVDSAERCLRTGSLIDYEELDARLRTLESQAREQFQDAHRRVYESIAEKLESGYHLSDVERGALELLIVGEAKYATESEKSFENWKKELHSLIEQIRHAERAAVTEAARLLQLQALCHTAKTILPDITLYLRDRERVQRFRDATAGEIRPEDARFLAALIRQILSSDKR